MAKSVPFVDREKELRVLENLALRGSETVLYIYGPEGCGKTVSSESSLGDSAA